MAGRRGRRRLSAEEGRAALLEAGRAMTRAQPAGPPLEHIRLTDVAARAGVSVGALYHYWDTQDDYRDDLLDDLFSPDRFEPTPTVPELVAALADDLQPIDEIVRQGADAEFETLRLSADLRVLMALWAADDPAIVPRIAAQFRSVGERWAVIYEAAFTAHGLEIRPPFTYATMAALFTAIGDGLAVRASVDPDSVPLDLAEPTAEGSRAWGLLGCALVALLPVLSRPIGSDETFWDALDRIRADLSSVDA